MKKLIRTPMKKLILTAFLTLFVTNCYAYDCEMIKQKVAEHGKWRAIAWALAHGYTPLEIRNVRKECHL